MLLARLGIALACLAPIADVRAGMPEVSARDSAGRERLIPWQEAAVVEHWTASGRELRVDADLLAGLGSDDTLVIRAERVEIDVPAARWLDAGSPDPLVVTIPWRRRPSPQAVADCPDDAMLECDGFGNASERQAWLDRFTGTADPGCGAVTRILETQPGILEPILTFADFSDLSAWTLNGRAATIGNPALDDAGRRVLRLTSGFSESGSAFVTNPVTLGADSSFRAFFAFRISLSGGTGDTDGVGADGLAFVVQTQSNTAGGLGGGIGYQGISPSVGVELDTYDNGAWDDFNGNHAGIDVGGNIDSIAQAPVPRRMNDGDVWSAWVDYDGRTDWMEVRLDPAGLRPALPAVAATVDLPAILGGTNAFVGFTSGTGAGIGTHDILSFVFEAYAPVTCPNRGVESVTSTVVDGCGNAAACTRLLWTIDTTAPKLVPEAPVATCGGVLFADGGPDGSAVSSPRVRPSDACGSFVVRNDRTSGGADATDTYPCGMTVVQFDAVDDCGNASTCDVVVSVQPGIEPGLVGGVLRVGKSAAGEPVLDWSACALPPSVDFVVLARDGFPLPRPHAWPRSARTWTDPAAPAVRWYDVRSLDCSGAASRD